MGLFDIFKKKEETKEVKKEEKLVVCSPLDGEVFPIEETPDEAFAGKMMGDGIMILPTNGDVVAPFDAEVVMTFPTKHAVGLKAADGTEVLIHFGIDTVSLNGEGFELFVEQGQKVNKGDKLISADIDFIKSKNIPTNVPMVFTSMDTQFEVVKNGAVVKGDEIIKIK